MYSPATLLRLAIAQAEARNRALSTVSKWACGNAMTFARLAKGKGCNADTLARASQWFDNNADASWWPQDIPLPRSTEAAE